VQRDLNGIVHPGRGLGAGLMADATVIERLRELARFSMVPGTLNVRLPKPLERGAAWRYVAAASISPDWEARTGQAGYFLAPVVIEGRYRGLAFQADESAGPGYPADQIELFSDVHLRDALDLSDGDPIRVALTDPPTGEREGPADDLRPPAHSTEPGADTPGRDTEPR
jgi:CTP-dependent riboflavin kinase